MTTIMRFLKVFTLGTWIGCMVFFGFVEAPVLFSKLTNLDTAGAIVGLSLAKLHLFGVIAAVVFLLAAMVEDRSARGLARVASLGVLAMLILTLVSQLWLMPEMDALRAQMGSYMATAANNPLRIEFDHLHRLSVRLEGAILILGLVSLFLTVAQKPRSRQLPEEPPPAPSPAE